MGQGKLNLYSVGAGGVNLTKNPHELADDELTQAQNAEVLPDQARGGLSCLSQRGGLTALTSALAGSVLGMVNLPLKTTYTRTLYVSMGENSGSSRWKKTTNGSSWTDTTSPLVSANQGDAMEVVNYEAAWRIASVSNKLYYPGSNHNTESTASNNTAPELSFFQAAPSVASAELFSIPIGPSSDGNHSFGIVDMLVANNKIYLAVFDPDASGAPDFKGRVMSFDPVTGLVAQIGNAFGPGTGEVTGGYPACLAWHQGQLFAGLNGDTGLGAVAGKVVRIRPDSETSWTTDVVALLGFPTTMETFKGDMYVGMRGFASTTAPRIYKRAATTGTYSSVDNGADNGITFYSSLTVYNDVLYVVLYESGGTRVMHIRKSSDGASWSTDYDVDANQTIEANVLPTNGIVYNGDLFFSFRSASNVDPNGQNGLILRRSGGSWTAPVTAANIVGHMGILLERT